MGKYEENRDKLQELVKEAYDKAGKPRSNDLQKDVKDIYEDTAMQEIIASYNKKYGVDIQQELRAYLEPTTMERIRSDIDGKNVDEMKKQEQKEISRTVSEVSNAGIGVDGATKDEIEKNVEKEQENQEKGEISTDEENLRALVYKAMYKAVLEDYYNLKLGIQERGPNNQLETGDISVGDRNGTKLVLYEKYLKNIDQNYKGLTRTSVIRDDEDIKKFEEGLAYRAGRNERAILKKNDDALDRVSELYQKRENIAEDIAYLSTRASTMSPEKFESQMDSLQKEYKEASARIYSISPNPLELQQSIEERAADERFRNKEVGDTYERVHNIQLGGKVTTLERENDVSLYQDVKESNEQTYESDAAIDKSADVILEQYYEAEERGNYAKAEELLQSLETMAGIKYEDVETAKTDETSSKTPDEIEEEQEEGRGNILNDPRLNAVNDDEDVAKIEAERDNRKIRAKAVEEKLNVKRNKTNEKEFEYTRTLYNNRRG